MAKPPAVPPNLPGTTVVLLAGLVPMLQPVAAVHPNPRNPRRVLDLERLVASIRRFGLRAPVVANRRDGMIEAGHQRYAACCQLGATHVPVLWADDHAPDALAYNVADNRVGETVAEWDSAALAQVFADLRAEDDSFLGVGYSVEQVEGMLSAFAPGLDLCDAPLAATPFDGDGERLLSGRMIIVYDTVEQRAALEERLGCKIKNVTTHVRDILSPKQG